MNYERVGELLHRLDRNEACLSSEEVILSAGGAAANQSALRCAAIRSEIGRVKNDLVKECVKACVEEGVRRSIQERSWWMRMVDWLFGRDS